MSAPKFPDYDRSVFINCPFDSDYQRLSDALVFAVYDCGYIPRCALEAQDGGQARIEKIYAIISQCRFGIHDISRTESDASRSGEKLPRFNMPLELGVFLGAKRYGNKRQRDKVCLVLDRDRYRYQQFCSDIAGNDIEAHDNNPQTAVTVVRNWLSKRGDQVREKLLPSDSGSVLFKRYEEFLRDLPALCVTPPLHLNPRELTFADYTFCCEAWLREHRR